MSNDYQLHSNRRLIRLLLLGIVLGAALSLFLALRASAQDLYVAANRPTCTDGSPMEIFIVDATSATSCTTSGGSTFEANCCCLDGTWAACSSGGGGGGGTDVALDLGDNGANESSAITEIATTNDDNSGFTEPTANKLLIDVSKFGRLPSFHNPPASAHSYDCEFDGDECSYTFGFQGDGTAAATGTVNPTASKTDPVKDFTTWSGWLLLQSDESGGGNDFVTLDLSVTLDTSATLCFSVMTANSSAAASLDSGEGGVRVNFINSGDSNETVYFRIDRDTSGQHEIEYGVQNNGSFTSADVMLSTAGSQAASSLDVGCIWKSTNNYYFGIFNDGTFLYSGSYSKTGVTTLDTIRIYFGMADETPSVINGINWIRYDNAVSMPQLNP